MANRHAKKIDNLVWGPFGGAFLAQAAGTAANLFKSVQTVPQTLMRLRGEALIYVDATQAPGGLTQVEMGIIKVPEGSGATARYGPSDDANAPWLWFASLHIGYEEMVTDVIDVPGISSARIVIDNRAMRRLRPDEELQIAIQSTTVGGAISVNAVYTGRHLVGF